MQEQDIKDLLSKYKAGACTEAEKALLEAWYLQYEDAELGSLSDDERAADLHQIRKSLIVEPRQGGVRSLYLQIITAAAVFLCVSAGVWLSFRKPVNSNSTETVRSVENDVLPGTNKAILTLADGSVINLDDALKGEIASQSGIVLSKPASGLLEYTAMQQTSLPPSGQPVKFNILRTPRGGQFRIKLPDGTLVWMNAGSSLKYPTWFSGDERRVELTGEAYFEVAPNEEMPFRVFSDNQMVEVLGTHFNISSYNDEDVAKTTLLEGSVRIFNLSDQGAGILKPGQQARINKHSLKVSTVDPAESIAWKNGFIVFENEKITSIMKKISRWYDVEIEYRGHIPVSDFTGSVSRFENVSKVLEILELTKSVHFKVEGRRIIVMP